MKFNKRISQLSKILSNLEISQDCNLFKVEINVFYKGNNANLVNALILAAEGDNRKLNNWLFSIPCSFNDVIPWLGKVKTENGKRYVWLVANLDSVGQSKIRLLLDQAWNKIRQDNLFFNPSIRPPYIVYLKSIVCSKWQMQQNISEVTNKIPQFGRIGMFVEGTALPHNKPLTPDYHEGVNMSSDIEIFQVNYTNEATTEDIEQKMPLNSDYFINKTNKLFERIKINCTEETIKFYEINILPNAEIITKLHAEIHNHGHFLGPYIYTKRDKSEETYEAIEEFRACLIVSVVSKHLDINEDIYLGLPVHIFLMRYIGFGFDSFLSGKNDIVNNREIEVGILFFNMLEKNDGIKIINNKLHIDFPSVCTIFINEVEKIHKLENENKHLGKIGLAQIAKNYRQDLYNDTRRNIRSYYEFLEG